MFGLRTISRRRVSEGSGGQGGACGARRPQQASLYAAFAPGESLVTIPLASLFSQGASSAGLSVHKHDAGQPVQQRSQPGRRYSRFATSALSGSAEGACAVSSPPLLSDPRPPPSTHRCAIRSYLEGCSSAAPRACDSPPRSLSCPQAKQFALQVQLVDLQERLKELELERTQHRAQLDALSQCMRNVSCVQPRVPFADRLAEARLSPSPTRPHSTAPSQAFVTRPPLSWQSQHRVWAGADRMPDYRSSLSVSFDQKHLQFLPGV